MRFVFHAMLGVSLVVASAGIVLGAQARSGCDAAATGPSHTAALRRGPREHVAIEQTIAPPLPVSPRYGAEVGSGPTLSWRLPAGTDGARVELCPTSDFSDATTRHLDVPGEELRLPAEWPAGVWYWRLRGREQGAVGDRATPTWMVYVAPVS
ncbi:MAG TPA: hypothetical protein VGG39_36910 [Polyangiaceae bacterium]|jgi:hypothetical protein